MGSPLLLILILFISELAQASPDWCSHFASGPSSPPKFELALSRAHSFRRFFGIGSRYSSADQALAAALEHQNLASEPNLENYALALPETCWLQARDEPAKPLELKIHDSVAWVRPGRGKAKLSSNLKALVLDLRDLPGAGLPKGGLKAFLAELIADSVPQPGIASRTHDGMTDEYLSSRSLFRNFVEEVSQPDLPSTGTFSGPIYVLMGERQTPEAAELAGTLRLADRGWIVDEPVRTQIAESVWAPVGKHGLAFRVEELHWQSRRWPDLIPADLSLPDLHDRVSLGQLERPPPGSGSKLLEVGSSRAAFEAVHPYRDLQPAAHGLGDSRAALLIAHGALRLFFPSFQPLGDRIDARLAETLQSVGRLKQVPTIGEERDLLRRFGEALHDGHSFVFAQPMDPAVKGYLPLVIETLGGKAIVRRSAVSGILPGDQILSLDGRTVRDFYAKQLRITSASTPGYRFDIANRELTKLKGTVRVVVASGKSGARRSIEVAPVPLQEVKALKPGTPYLRASGWLSGHAGVYYINLSAELLSDKKLFDQMIAEASASPGAKRLILDMRGYPGINPPDIVQAVMTEKFSSPIFRYIHYSAIRERSLVEKHDIHEPGQPPVFGGPVSLLVGPHTVSAAETLATFLVDARRVTVFGQSGSAGSNGDIAGMQLPGSLALTFAGMEVLHADRSRFLGIGIVPRQITPVTPMDLKTGTDPVLEAAARN